MNFRKGDRLRNPKCPEWGVGEVLEESIEKRTRVFFVDAGEKIISGQHVELVPVSGAEAESPLLDNLRLGKEKGIKYRSLPESIEYFLEQFPQGFYGERFFAEERSYKFKAHELACELLNGSDLAAQINAGAYAEICANAQRILNATNLVFPNEKMAFRDGLREASAQEGYARALFALLYGTDDIKTRFEDYAKVLSRIGADKWTTATYFQFILNPSDNMFVKPTVTQNAAALCGFNIDYRPTLNWITYSQVLKFSEYLRDKLVDLKPRDMIDVQSFMWCVAPA